MRVIIFTVIMFVTVNCNASIWTALKGMFGKSENTTNVAEQTNANKYGVVESLKGIEAKIDANAKVAVQGQAGVGNKITEMRDSINTTNLSYQKEVNKTITKTVSKAVDKSVEKNLTKINTSIKEINKTITQSNQASIFYVMTLVLGFVCICLIGMIGYLIPQFIDRNKLARELDRLRKEDKIK